MKKITFLLLFVCSLGRAENQGSIQWQDYSDTAFAQALKEKKLVLLDLKAVWCHWCHVMDEKTYANPEIIQLINKNYIAIKVDQDSRPDLANRYEDYGWPATIFYNSQGKEIAKRSGYIAPEKMKDLLVSLHKNPRPIADEKIDLKEAATILKSSQIQKMQQKIQKRYDHKLGGWDTRHKLLDANLAEYFIYKALAGDKPSEEKIKKLLQAQLKIIDPVWSGVYQYSAGGTWDEPHFEKIMSVQADSIKIYSLAWLAFKDPKYLKTAESIFEYVQKFLTSPEGAFYTSQDADLKPGEHSENYFKLDDQKRRALGIPRVDKNIYARENGWVIQSLISLYTATSDKKYLDSAIKAAQWIKTNRALPGAGFSHSEKDVAGPFLGDNLSMAQAFLRIYAATGQREWLQQAQKTADFISSTFPAGHILNNKDKVGFQTAVNKKSDAALQSEENLQITRFANLLYHYTGNEKYKQMSLQGMRYLTTNEMREYIYIIGGVLLANDELSKTPTHITVVGGKNDSQARTLFLAALRYPSHYIRQDWYDSAEGPLPFSETTYPKLTKPAAFACSGKRCSFPAYTEAEIQDRVKQLQK